MKRKSFFEPWSVRQVDAGCRPFKGEVIPDDMPREAVEKMLSDYERVKKAAPWIIWGTGIWKPGFATDYKWGFKVPCGSEGIIVSIQRSKPENEQVPDKMMAKRIVACVNSMKGVARPEQTMERIRALLQRLSRDFPNEVEVDACLYLIGSQKGEEDDSDTVGDGD